MKTGDVILINSDEFIVAKISTNTIKVIQTLTGEAETLLKANLDAFKEYSTTDKTWRDIIFNKLSIKAKVLEELGIRFYIDLLD